MTEGEHTRVIAWAEELRAVHRRLREAVRVIRAAPGEASNRTHAELLLFCHGFCTALTGHHQGEDRTLFPAIAAEHPELGDTLRNLEEDHALIAVLLQGLQAAVERSEPWERIEPHVEGIAAIMESHFQYEERQLVTVLDSLVLDADPREVYGPL